MRSATAAAESLAAEAEQGAEDEKSPMATRAPGLTAIDEPPPESVELRGFEPLTSSMPWRRATNCAKAPNDG